MPICFAEMNVDLVIKEITGSDKIKQRLQELGFVVGETVQVINKVNDSVIIKIKGVSLAVSKELARRVMI